MRHIKKMCKTIVSQWHQIAFVDQCLFVFLIVLLVQGALCVFIRGENPAEISGIDAILRTSTAGIFGYFLSSNFLTANQRKSPEESNTNTPQTIEINSSSAQIDTPKNRNAIGFQTNSQTEQSDMTTELSSAEIIANQQNSEYKAPTNKFQVILATAVGLYCIVFLSIMRHYAILNPDIMEYHTVIVTVSQLRDFVAACIGFLTGVPSPQNK